MGSMNDEESDRKFVTEALSRHVVWYESVRTEHRQHFAAYDDDFWRSRQDGGGVWDVVAEGVAAGGDDGVTANTIHPTEVNLARPFVGSHMASLYYEGVFVEVEPDELAKPGETEGARARRAAAVEALCNRWLARPNVLNATERVIQMSLMYRGGVAYKVTLDPDAKGEPDAAVKLHAIPPWELVYDRRTRTEDGLRFIGHLRQESIEYVARLGELDVDEVKGAAGLADVVQDGFTQGAVVDEDRSYLWVLTLDNLVGSAQVEIEGAADLVVIPGKRSEFLVDAVGNGKVRRLRQGPSPYTDAAGKPLSEMVPFIAEPIPQRPWDSIAPLATTYTLNAELNAAMSVTAGQFRRDAPRRILTTDELDEETANKLKKAADGEFIKVPPPSEGGGRLTDRYHVVNLGDVPNSTLTYVSFLRDGLERSQSTSDLSRGKAGQYMRAETARSLVEYDEAFIGRVRKRSDVAIVRVVELFLQAAATKLGKGTIKIVIDVPKEDGTTATSVYDLTRDDLERAWKIQVIDSATKPGDSQQELAATESVIPTMMELAAAADPPDPASGMPSPTQQAFARAMFDHLATKAGLPPGMRFAPLHASAPAPAAPPEPPPPAPAPEAPAPASLPPEAPPGAGAPPGGLAEGIITAAEAGL